MEILGYDLQDPESVLKHVCSDDGLERLDFSDLELDPLDIEISDFLEEKPSYWDVAARPDIDPEMLRAIEELRESAENGITPEEKEENLDYLLCFSLARNRNYSVDKAFSCSSEGCHLGCSGCPFETRYHKIWWNSFKEAAANFSISDELPDWVKYPFMGVLGGIAIVFIHIELSWIQYNTSPVGDISEQVIQIHNQ